MKTYQHLQLSERYQIAAFLQAGFTQKAIAMQLNRSPSSISRELKRTEPQSGVYQAEAAQHLAQLRGKNSRNARQIPYRIWLDVESRLKRYHSPEQIAGSLKGAVSTESIYHYIYGSESRAKRLKIYLRSQKKWRKRYGSTYKKRGEGKRSITERPDEVESRADIAHWEGDTIVSPKDGYAIVTLVERKTGFTLMKKVTKKTAEEVKIAMIAALKPYRKILSTITVDNGTEFSYYATVDTVLGCKTYFAEPYKPYQQGTNENTNGLIRQFIPKNRLILKVSESEIEWIQYLLNSRPRKRLGYKTPIELVAAIIPMNCTSYLNPRFLGLRCDNN